MTETPTSDEYGAFADEIEAAVRRATDHRPVGVERADVAIGVAVRLLTEQPDRATRLGRDLPSREPSAGEHLDQALNRCAALLREQLGDSLDHAAARGIVSTLLTLALNDLERPGAADPATIITASTIMLRGIVPAEPPSPRADRSAS